MKRFFAFAVLTAVFAVSCTKSEMAQVSKDNIISFQTANYAGTKVNGSIFPTDETFSVFAWTDGTTGEYFMNNVGVAYSENDNLWKPSTTYYWPGNNQGVDFFGYYPSGMSGLSVATNRLLYNNINFANTQIDMMYSDKAVGYTGNENNYGHTGVPILFRHAGAKLTILATLGTSQVEDEDGNVTRWEVDLKGANLSGIYTTGSCVLDLASEPTLGIVSWVKPTDENGYNVWSHTTAVNSNLDSKYSNTRHYAMATGESQTVIREFYVLPQTLVEDQQKINLTLVVRTYSKPADAEEETLVMENEIAASADLLCEAIPAWQMNHSAVYTLVIRPTGSYDPQPIFFDPYVVPWTTVTNNTYIDLNLN